MAGVKPTSLGKAAMSANDPKRTWWLRTSLALSLMRRRMTKLVQTDCGVSRDREAYEGQADGTAVMSRKIMAGILRNVWERIYTG